MATLSMREALEQITARRDALRDNGTVTPDSAYEAFNRLNKTLCEFGDMARAALASQVEQEPVRKFANSPNTDDAGHVAWIYWRLANIHGESKNYDYMLRLWEIVERLRAHPAPSADAIARELYERFSPNRFTGFDDLTVPEQLRWLDHAAALAKLGEREMAFPSQFTTSLRKGEE